jgi:hypothetical protein
MKEGYRVVVSEASMARLKKFVANEHRMDHSTWRSDMLGNKGAGYSFEDALAELLTKAGF